MLELRVKHSWVDPRKVDDKEKFFYDYCLAWGFGMAADEILQFVEGKRSIRDTLLAKKEGKEVNNFKIGA